MSSGKAGVEQTNLTYLIVLAHRHRHSAAMSGMVVKMRYTVETDGNLEKGAGRCHCHWCHQQDWVQCHQGKAGVEKQKKKNLLVPASRNQHDTGTSGVVGIAIDKVYYQHTRGHCCWSTQKNKDKDKELNGILANTGTLGTILCSWVHRCRWERPDWISTPAWTARQMAHGGQVA